MNYVYSAPESALAFFKSWTIAAQNDLTHQAAAWNVRYIGSYYLPQHSATFFLEDIHIFGLSSLCLVTKTTVGCKFIHPLYSLGTKLLDARRWRLGPPKALFSQIDSAGIQRMVVLSWSMVTAAHFLLYGVAWGVNGHPRRYWPWLMQPEFKELARNGIVEVEVGSLVGGKAKSPARGE